MLFRSEIAKLAGVTRATVSYVLNNRTDLKISDETRNKILAISKQYDYKPPVKVKKRKARQTSAPRSDQTDHDGGHCEGSGGFHRYGFLCLE